MANDHFRIQCDLLVDDPAAVSVLQGSIVDAPLAVMSAKLSLLVTDRPANPAARQFAIEALAYRNAIDKLAEAQRSIVIRNTKLRFHRVFQVGQDFTKAQPQPQRMALYETRGMSKDAFTIMR